MSDSAASVRARLAVDEHVLWTGGPDPAVLLGPQDVFLIPFSLLWAGFAVFWEIAVVTSDAPLIFCLSGVPFLLVGAHITVGRFIVKRWLASRSTYVLTDRRAIVVLPRSTVELRLPGPAVTVRQSRNGRHATVGFGSSTSARGDCPPRSCRRPGRAGSSRPSGPAGCRVLRNSKSTRPPVPLLVGADYAVEQVLHAPSAGHHSQRHRHAEQVCARIARRWPSDSVRPQRKGTSGGVASSPVKNQKAPILVSADCTRA